ncbi:hypothetical protein AURDEDRAFT_126906 [Auricularia subglabra TFB-10046 SS5]|nr:hypothetical protein AURDEDRAFT_126906 [Auricularia subglabra TFB-10046 SS5]
MSNPAARNNSSHPHSSIPGGYGAHPSAFVQGTYVTGLAHGTAHSQAAPYYGQSSGPQHAQGGPSVGVFGSGLPRNQHMPGTPGVVTRIPYPGWRGTVPPGPHPPEYNPARVRLPPSRDGSTLSVPRPALAGNHILLSSPLGGAQHYPGSQQSGVLPGPANRLSRLANGGSARSTYARYQGIEYPDPESQYTLCHDCGNMYNRSDTADHEVTCEPACPICNRNFPPDQLRGHIARCTVRAQAIQAQTNAANGGAAASVPNIPQMEAISETESSLGDCTSFTDFYDVISASSQSNWRTPTSSRRSGAPARRL